MKHTLILILPLSALLTGCASSIPPLTYDKYTTTEARAFKEGEVENLQYTPYEVTSTALIAVQPGSGFQIQATQ